jgi:hypothetical protein
MMGVPQIPILPPKFCPWFSMSFLEIKCRQKVHQKVDQKYFQMARTTCYWQWSKIAGFPIEADRFSASCTTILLHLFRRICTSKNVRQFSKVKSLTKVKSLSTKSARFLSLCSCVSHHKSGLQIRGIPILNLIQILNLDTGNQKFSIPTDTEKNSVHDSYFAEVNYHIDANVSRHANNWNSLSSHTHIQNMLVKC